MNWKRTLREVFMPTKKYEGGVPGWAWCITWGIMLLGVILNAIVLIMRLTQ